ncbi:MAG: bifunctional DNA-formamidopyrimidine glycosylase/DNA-(apurinic or apyrimidinic site) lyase [Acidobacteria bacterium]|nr:bifunctional DNA-formamidopyrimidine glycosylase/DNA-(apurinic or apyrimidinic site) lyase [Acidobacteriota bacterium]
MPELPEVETIVRALAVRLQGATVTSAKYWPSRVFRGVTPPPLDGAFVKEVRRHGKFVLIELNRGYLAIHLGMTGKLLFDVPQNKYTRAQWLFDGLLLSLEDIRQFGRVIWSEGLPEGLRLLGPDPLEISSREFVTRARSHRTGIKSLLLAQTFVRGLGNIYVDELLFRASVHPTHSSASLSQKQLTHMWQEMRALLEEAIEGGGSSISDYVDTAGRQGTFQREHRVYGRAGEPCLACGSPIQKITLAQRGTHFCPVCQKV